MTINVSRLAVLAVGGLLVLQGRLTVGAMLAVSLYNTFLAVGLAELAGSLGDLGNSLGSLQRRAPGTVWRDLPVFACLLALRSNLPVP